MSWSSTEFCFSIIFFVSVRIKWVIWFQTKSKIQKGMWGHGPWIHGSQVHRHFLFFFWAKQKFLWKSSQHQYYRFSSHKFQINSDNFETISRQRYNLREFQIFMPLYYMFLFVCHVNRTFENSQINTALISLSRKNICACYTSSLNNIH